MIAIVALRILHHTNLRGGLSTRPYKEESHGFPTIPMAALRIPTVFRCIPIIMFWI